MGISDETFYARRKKSGGFGSSEVRRLRQLGEENRVLKQIVSDLDPDSPFCGRSSQESSEAVAASLAGA